MIELLYTIVKEAVDKPIPAAPSTGIGAGMPTPAGGDPMQNEIMLQQAGDEQAKLHQELQTQQQQSAQAVQQAEATAAQKVQQAEATTTQQQQKAQEQISSQTIAAQQATANSEIEKAKMKAEVDLMKAKAKAEKPTGKPQPSMWGQRLQNLQKRVQKSIKIATKAHYEDQGVGGFLTGMADNVDNRHWRDAADAALGPDKEPGKFTLRNIGRSFNRGAANVADWGANTFNSAVTKPLLNAVGGQVNAYENVGRSYQNAAEQVKNKGIWDTDWGAAANAGVSKIPGNLAQGAMGSGMLALNAIPGAGLMLNGAGHALNGAFDTWGGQAPQQQAPAGDPWRIAQGAIDQFGPQPAAPDPYDTWQNNGLAGAISGGPYAAQQWNRGMSMYPRRDYGDIGKFQTPWMNTARDWISPVAQLAGFKDPYAPDTDSFQNPGGFGSDSGQLAQMTPQSQGIQQFLQMMAGGGRT